MTSDPVEGLTESGENSQSLTWYFMDFVVGTTSEPNHGVAGYTFATLSDSIRLLETVRNSPTRFSYLCSKVYHIRIWAWYLREL